MTSSLREEILSLLEKYDRALESGLPERQVHRWLLSADALVPHGWLTDLIFYGEKARSREEAVDEAIYREQLWQSQGQRALLVHLEIQLRTAIEAGVPEGVHRYYAERTLAEISKELAALTGSRPQ